MKSFVTPGNAPSFMKAKVAVKKPSSVDSIIKAILEGEVKRRGVLKVIYFNILSEKFSLKAKEQFFCLKIHRFTKDSRSEFFNLVELIEKNGKQPWLVNQLRDLVERLVEEYISLRSAQLLWNSVQSKKFYQELKNPVNAAIKLEREEITLLDLPEDVKALAIVNCISGTSSKGGVRLFDSDRYTVTKELKSKILAEVSQSLSEVLQKGRLFRNLDGAFKQAGELVNRISVWSGYLILLKNLGVAPGEYQQLHKEFLYHPDLKEALNRVTRVSGMVNAGLDYAQKMFLFANYLEEFTTQGERSGFVRYLNRILDKKFIKSESIFLRNQRAIVRMTEAHGALSKDFFPGLK